MSCTSLQCYRRVCNGHLEPGFREISTQLSFNMLSVTTRSLSSSILLAIDLTLERKILGNAGLSGHLFMLLPCGPRHCLRSLRHRLHFRSGTMNQLSPGVRTMSSGTPCTPRYSAEMVLSLCGLIPSKSWSAVRCVCRAILYRY